MPVFRHFAQFYLKAIKLQGITQRDSLIAYREFSKDKTL